MSLKIFRFIIWRKSHWNWNENLFIFSRLLGLFSNL